MGDSLLSVDVTSVVVFVVFGLILGVLVELLLRNLHIPIPYTVLVFYSGVASGVILNAFNVQIAEFLTLSTVSADIIVYGFLPTLLFSETMGLNTHHLFQSFNQAVILAGPGAVLECIMLAVLAYLILPFHWGWMYCFLFGAILSATDPVSVVSLMKSTNCSTKLTMVISGESLLNDGSAMILYLFFYNMINGFVYDAQNFIGFCAEMLILSPLIGFVMGLACSYTMRKINTPTNPNLDFQLILTFICAYFSYFIPAKLLDISGVLSCCAAGVSVSVFAPVLILHQEKFHQVWSYAEWACNTLIFLLAGVIGGGRSASDLTTEKVGYLVVFFVLLTVTRGIMAFTFLPLLNRAGEPCTVEETLFMTFAGLRGALGIALALQSADNAGDNGNEDIGKDLFFMISGLASFTLLINGSTAGWVLLKLKLVEDPNAPISPQLQQVLNRIRAFISTLLVAELEKIKPELGDYDEEELQQLCKLLYTDRKISTFSATARFSLLMRSTVSDRRSQTERNSRSSQENIRTSSMDKQALDLKELSNFHESSASKHRDSMEEDENLDADKVDHRHFKDGHFSVRVSESVTADQDLLKYTRTTFLEVVRARYTEAVHSGKMSSTSTPTRVLYYSIDVALDHVSEGLMDWSIIIKLLKPPPLLLRICQFIDDIFYLCGFYPGLVSFVDVRYERIAIYVISNFIYAHQYAQSKIHYFLGGPVNDQFDIAEPEHNRVMEESKQLVVQAKELLKLIGTEDIRRVNTHRAAKIVLLKQAEILHTIVHDGILSEKNSRNLMEALEVERDRIHVLRARHEKTMIRENIKERINAEKEIRESARSKRSFSSLMNLPRSILRLNLTGEDNFDRLSNMSSLSRTNSLQGTAGFDTSGRPSVGPVYPPPSAAVPGVAFNPILSPRVVSSGGGGNSVLFASSNRAISSRAQSPPIVIEELKDISRPESKEDSKST